MPLCSVCQVAESEFHFGGVSCRACAAFFRRFVHSKKRYIRCTCCTIASDSKNSHPCRQCRMIKCLEAGLQRNKVQPIREPNTVSLTTECRIISRDCSKIQHTSIKWHDSNEKRRLLYGPDVENMSLYEVSCLTKKDAMIMWQMVEELFPSLSKLRMTDKDSLIANFMSKFMLIELSFEVTTWFQSPKEFSECTDRNGMLIYKFYNGSIPDDRKMGMKEILEIFWPFWKFYYDRIIIPIYETKSDLLESMAQILLVIFDPAYMNISVECAEVCRQLQNLILRELKGYLAEKNRKEDRFFNLLGNLKLLENAEKKFQEEVQMCELYHVRLHDDFRKMMLVEKL